MSATDCHPPRVVERQLRGDRAAHRVTDEMRALHVDGIEEAGDEASELAERPAGQLAIRLAMPGEVEGDYRACLGERVEVEEPVVEVAAEAVQQQGRRAAGSLAGVPHADAVHLAEHGTRIRPPLPRSPPRGRRRTR